MVQNLDSLVRRALLGGFFVLSSYGAFAPTSQAVAQDGFRRTAYATNPATANPAVRQVAGYRYETPQYQVPQYQTPQYRPEYVWGHRRHSPGFDRWFYVKQAIVCLHNTPLLADMPKVGHYHVLYPAYPRTPVATAVRVKGRAAQEKSAQGNYVPGVVSLRSSGATPVNYNPRGFTNPNRVQFPGNLRPQR